MFASTMRSLNPKEQRVLRRRLAIVLAQATRQRRRLVISWLLTFAVLWFATILASKESWPAVTLLWLAIALPIAAWGVFEVGKKARARSRNLAAAREGGYVREVRIISTAVVDFEEEEDEGAQYAFDLGGGTLVFVTGQDFYPTPRFPNSDFSLLYLHAPDGKLVEFSIETHGEPLASTRTISAAVKRHLRIPEHLERVQASLADIERVLAA